MNRLLEIYSSGSSELSYYSIQEISGIILGRSELSNYSLQEVLSFITIIFRRFRVTLGGLSFLSLQEVKGTLIILFRKFTALEL
jgi:hypothetical protein